MAIRKISAASHPAPSPLAVRASSGQARRRSAAGRAAQSRERLATSASRSMSATEASSTSVARPAASVLERGRAVVIDPRRRIGRHDRLRRSDVATSGRCGAVRPASTSAADVARLPIDRGELAHECRQPAVHRLRSLKPSTADSRLSVDANGSAASVAGQPADEPADLTHFTSIGLEHGKTETDDVARLQRQQLPCRQACLEQRRDRQRHAAEVGGQARLLDRRRLPARRAASPGRTSLPALRWWWPESRGSPCPRASPIAQLEGQQDDDLVRAGDPQHLRPRLAVRESELQLGDRRATSR